MEYSSEVRRRFASPDRAGEITATTGPLVVGEAEDRSLSVWVRFHIRFCESGVEQARFRAFGCPHMIAAADRLAELVEGQRPEALADIDFETLGRELGVPRDKFGKLLCLEDALSACTEQARNE